LAFNKYPLSPGTILSSPGTSLEAVSVKAMVWVRALAALSQGAAAKENMHLEELVSSHENASGVFYRLEWGFIFSWVSCWHLENESEIMYKYVKLSLEIIWELNTIFTEAIL